jgi:hypothetical protein
MADSQSAQHSIRHPEGDVAVPLQITSLAGQMGSAGRDAGSSEHRDTVLNGDFVAMDLD